MWNLCRRIVLPQLRLQTAKAAITCSSATSTSRTIFASTSTVCSPFFSGGVQQQHQYFFSTSSSFAKAKTVDAHDDESTKLINADRLLRLSKRDIMELLDEKALHEARQEMYQQYLDQIHHVSQSSNKSDKSQIVRDFFMIGSKINHHKLITRTFFDMLEFFPMEMNDRMFLEMFRISQKTRDGKKMQRIYEQITMEPKTEAMYRFGIAAKCFEKDLDQARQLAKYVEEKEGIVLSHDIIALLMLYHAKQGQKEFVIEWFDRLDPQIGEWHENTIDKIITSMGMIELPEKAFEFYVHSNMKLNGGTLVALLKVCMNNGCEKQAHDILTNRTKFPMQLDVKAYNVLLQTLEFLHRQEEIDDMLREMQSKNIRFDSLTRDIIHRNQAFLPSNSFYLIENLQKEIQRIERKKIDKIQFLFHQKDFEQALIVANELTNLSLEKNRDIHTHMKEFSLSPYASIHVVKAFLYTKQHDKIQQILDFLQKEKGFYAKSLMEILQFYTSKKNLQQLLVVEEKKQEQQQQDGHKQVFLYDQIAYKTLLTMQKQGLKLYWHEQAMKYFDQFHDVDAAILLLNETLQDKDINSNKKHRLTLLVLPLCIRNGRFEKVLELLKVMDTFEEEQKKSNAIKSSLYCMLIQQMRQVSQAKFYQDHIGLTEEFPLQDPKVSTKTTSTSTSTSTSNKKTIVRYTSKHFEQILKEMQQRQLPINKRVVASLTPVFALCSKRHQLLLLELYTQAITNHASVKQKSPFQFNEFCYASLMNVALRQEEYELVVNIFQDAMKSRENIISTQLFSRDWYTTLILALVQMNKIEEAHEKLLDMYTKCGEKYSYRALIALGKYHSKMAGTTKTKTKEEHSIQLKEIMDMLEQGNFHLSLLDASEFVYDAKKRNDPKTTFEIIRLFEKANFITCPPPQEQELTLRENVQLSKVIAMYRAAIGLCETNGLWKKALLFNERLDFLLTLKEKKTTNASNHEEEQTQQQQQQLKQNLLK